MVYRSQYRWRITEIPLSLLVLVILLGFTVGIFVRIPYTGFYFDPNSGVILDVYIPDNSSLQSGDVLVRVGDIPFNDFAEDSTRPLFANGIKTGDVIPMLVNRAGNEILVDWELPGFNLIEFRGRILNIYWLAYIFWFFGALVEMFIRPRDVRWWLFIAINHFTGLWLMMGAISSWHMLGSSLLFHALTWLLLPVYLHLHWVFPEPLNRLPKNSGIFLYSIAILMAIGELIQILPNGLFFLAFVLALGGSFILLVLHFILRPAQRNQIRLLALSTFLAVLPILLVGIIGLFGEMPIYAPITLATFVFMPTTYLYLIFRNRLGGLEARVNRFISLFAFLILVGILLIVVAYVTAFLAGEASAVLVIVLPLVISAISIGRFPSFEAFVEKNFFGIKLPYQHLPETYASRIAVSTSLSSLLALLKDEVFPSLLIRQYAFLQADEKNLTSLLAKDIPNTPFDFDTLTQKAGSYIPSAPSNDDWTRLILPLRVGDKTLGFWLLGKRDPDDLYPQVEIPILQSLADQTAIALSNILNAEQLRDFYQADIENIEYERRRISRDLHDTVLNELAAMRNSLGQAPVPPAFLSIYDHVKNRLREIINDIRPPILDQGLASALSELVEDLREKNENMTILLELQSSAERLPEKMEEHIYNIVREACENVLHHADARTLTISGEISPARVDLSIQDDGKGFDTNNDLNTLIANRHFGLVNMKERAHILGAEMEIRSAKNEGTKIHVIWQK